MKTWALLLAAAALAISACTQTDTPVAPSGGSEGALGDAYCETPPASAEDLTQWNQVCHPGGRL